jgi:hypothetical protein
VRYGASTLDLPTPRIGDVEGPHRGYTRRLAPTSSWQAWKPWWTVPRSLAGDQDDALNLVLMCAWAAVALALRSRIPVATHLSSVGS